MTHRRRFLQASFLAATAPSMLSAAAASTPEGGKKKEWKHWVWIRPSQKDAEADLRRQYRKFYDAGIRGIFFEDDSEMHYRVAKGEKLEAHRWMWTMNRGEKSLLQTHPEWYSKNRKGESCADKPPYVDYYRWLCPSREEVARYLEADVQRILEKDYIDGIHLDYVRFCDVVLPVNLWDKYKMEQTRELPEYDYCYCEVCRQKFREWRGQDIQEMPFPEENLSWRLYRYNAITNIVNRLAAVARSKQKPITAAVFPTPEVARRNVRQDWVAWQLDGICPMIYHGFYKEPVAWIGDAVEEGVKALHQKFPLYAGIFLPDFKNATEVQQGMTYALQNGAAGISLFGDVTDDVLRALQQASTSTKNLL